MSSFKETREQRRRKLGIDCVSRILWRHWEPNNEYVKKIRIMNAESWPQTIKYEQPLRRNVFLLEFPEPVTLSSGMSFDLEVRFCPTELVELQDVVKVTVVGRGSFTVRLECQTPYARLLVPSQHDFAFVAVGDTAAHTVTMKNSGTVAVGFEWCVMAPFAITPDHGVLDEGESVTLSLLFAPVEACALVAQAVCKMTDNNEVLATIKLSGVGKYPFIRLAEPRPACDGNTLLLDFGRLLTATSQGKEFSLENPAMVDAAFALEAADNAVSCPFTITPSSGVIRRGTTQKFKVVFAPVVSGMTSVNAYRLATLTGNAVLVQLRGVALAPAVRTSTNIIDFGDVQLGKEACATPAGAGDRGGAHQRSFLIKNASEVAQEFCFMPSAPGVVFAVEPVSGQLPAKGSVRVKVVFNPTHPINYLRRLLILVQHSESLLYVDVFGSAYDGSIRPMPMKPRDVEAFFLRHEYGLAGAQPKDIAAITEALRTGRSYEDLAHGDLISTPPSAGLGQRPSSSPSTQPGSLKGVTRRRKGRLNLSYLLTSFSAGAPFCLDTDTLVFAHDGDGSQQVLVYNRTNAPATAYWCVPPSGCAFSVLPLQEDIPPQSSRAFTVTMNLSAYVLVADQFLECYVNFRQMRSFRLVEDGAFTPPHFFTLRCQRELAINASYAGTFAPVVHASQSITFPACRSGSVVHALLDLENRGEVAVMFTVGIHIDSLEPKGKVKEAVPNLKLVLSDPTHGIMAPHQRLPVLLTFLPTLAARVRGGATITLNDSPRDTIEVAFCGESFSPELVIEDSSMIVLRPTCVTGETRRQLRISNPTCISVTFEVQPSRELACVLKINPTFGVLEAGQQMELTLLFTPDEATIYEGCINFCISNGDTGSTTFLRGDGDVLEEDQKHLISCPCTAEGHYAVVEVEPVSMEHEGPALQKKTFVWTIYNSSLCEVCYEVRWLAVTEATRCQEHIEPSVQLSHNKSGTLAARSHTVVLVTLRPQTGYSEYILYTLVGGSGVPLSTIPQPKGLEEVRQHPHCVVQLRGTRPAVQITDVRSLEQHRSQLWCQLAINDVNAVLAAPVQANDLENDSFAFLQYIRGLEPIFMDMGVGSVHDASKEILLCFENAGNFPASFRFWDPLEHEGGNETWFLDDEEMEDVQQILCNRLLEISPRTGTIAVGAQQVITITYHHAVVGGHSLPVLLRLEDGKKALLVLEGRTVAPDTGVLAFHRLSAYTLHPVALGELEPPLQTTTIENVGSKPVTYIVQEDLTQRVTQMNCGFPVFQCLNPTGMIPAGGSAQLHWYFRPLEARRYRIDVALRTVDGEGYEMEFVGLGYHPKKDPLETTRGMINDAFLPIPVAPALRLPVEKCPLALSMDVMRIGAAPCFSLHRRFCYLENRHPRHTYSFLWGTYLEPGSSTVTVTPSGGVLGPGGRVRCLLTLHCGSLSQVLETSIFCHVRNETLITAPGKKPRGVATAAMEDKLADSEVGEEDAYDDPLLDAKTPRGKAFERSTCTKPRLLGYGGKRMSATVPPPEYQSMRMIAAAAAAAAAAAETYTTNSFPASSTPTMMTPRGTASRRPLGLEDGPVLEHSLEVLVQARIISMEEYERLYGRRALQQLHFPTLCQHYVDSTVLSQFRKERVDKIGAYSSDEAAVALRVLDGLLRAIIARPLVRASFTEPVRERIPYYSEMVCAEVGSVLRTGGASAFFTNPCESTTDVALPPRFRSADTKVGKQAGGSLPTAPAMPLRETTASNGVVRNILEEVLADVTLQAVDAVTEKLHLLCREALGRVDSS
ncbi:hypothetical protein TraAM80_03909 [Trypanosoma rangeli]|uniref:Abnormal spindle-like microcephaly-associated protein ASH domain-containing protein n=1 Tax=Trypanosoma rangeli TaxID=5698 RepID=A0A422NLX3_TRYRA|nr:uncharacterized protein TraAM80_03909 [Trypanosoma rangeli]RNF06455.1 hypothetical protein TraAM80_03909 [Trypanosoma rangeli]|eukprot:RNF06455.1 hypothetical protein TraAM80_03909 [Trypanosoma rangeli]